MIPKMKAMIYSIYKDNKTALYSICTEYKAVWYKIYVINPQNKITLSHKQLTHCYIDLFFIVSPNKHVSSKQAKI